MSLLLKGSVYLRGQRLARRLNAAAENPQAAQQKLLGKILAKNADTTFGREHGFSHIATERDYRQQVPIRDYEGFRPFVNRIITGEKSVLTAEPPLMFTLTSGTTGEPKYIPVTQEAEALGSRLMLQWLYRALLDHPQYLDSASVGVVSQATEHYTPSGIPCGSVSGRIYQHIPTIVQNSYAIPYPVFEVKNYDQRYFLIARFGLERQVSFIATPNPATLVRLAQVATMNQESLIRAIHDGTVGLECSEQPELVTQLAKWLKPNPVRARELARIAEATDALCPKDCWPQLQLIACWTGGSVGLQVQKLSEYYGPAVPIRDLGYLASEGRITLPYQDHTPVGILALNTNYYEFIPEEELGSPQPQVLPSHELVPGKRYGILLTTAAGLYRYDIHDIVEVIGFYRRAPLLAFIRKGKDMTNIMGEKMHVNHILLAMEQIRQQYQLPVVQYRVTPNLERNCYDFYLELQPEMPVSRLQQVIRPAIDQALAAVNMEYAQKRQSKRLGPPRLHLMRPGWSEVELRRLIASSRQDVQYKWRILCHQASLEDRQAVATTIEEDAFV